MGAAGSGRVGVVQSEVKEERRAEPGSGDTSVAQHPLGTIPHCALHVLAAHGARRTRSVANPLTDEARRTADPARRTTLYRQAQRLVHDEVGVITTVYPVMMTVLSHFRRVGLKWT